MSAKMKCLKVILPVSRSDLGLGHHLASEEQGWSHSLQLQKESEGILPEIDRQRLRTV